MSLADWLTGVAYLVVVYGALGVGTALIAKRHLRHLNGVPLVLACGVIWTGALIGIHMVAGVLGVLSRPAVLVLALGFVLAGWWFTRGASEPGADEVPLRRVRSTRTSWILAGVPAAALAAWIVARVWRATVELPDRVDALTFHLPNVGRWIQSHTFWRIDEYAPLLALGHYPQNGDVVFLSVVLAFDNDALIGLVNPVYVVLAGLAVYAIGCEIGAPRSTSMLFAALFASLPVMSLTAYANAQTDPIMYAMFGAGALFLLRQFRTGRRADLVLAGVGLGIAFGTKWYGIPSVAIVLAVWGAAWLIARRPVIGLVREGALLSGLVLLAGGFWLLRNLVESGNPVVPVEVKVLGATIFSAAHDFVRECSGFTIANYLTDGSAWSDYILPAFKAEFGLPGLVLALGTALAAVLIVQRMLRGRRGTPDHLGPALAVVAAAVLLAIAYTLLPYTALGPKGQPLLVAANTRYLVPALLACAAAGAWAVGHLTRWPRTAGEVVAAVAVFDGISRGFDVPRTQVAAGLVVVLGLTAAVLVVRRVPPSTRRLVTVAALVGGLVVATAVGYERQQDFNRDRYLGRDAALDWLLRHAPEGQKVALAGTWTLNGVTPVWPAFGPRLGNEVEYLGHTVDAQLREYDDRPAWRSALARGGYDYLIVGRGDFSGGCDLPGEGSDDEKFARESGLTQLARSDRLTLFRVPSN